MTITIFYSLAFQRETYLRIRIVEGNPYVKPAVFFCNTYDVLFTWRCVVLYLVGINRVCCKNNKIPSVDHTSVQVVECNVAKHFDPISPASERRSSMIIFARSPRVYTASVPKYRNTHSRAWKPLGINSTTPANRVVQSGFGYCRSDPRRAPIEENMNNRTGGSFFPFFYIMRYFVSRLKASRNVFYK